MSKKSKDAIRKATESLDILEDRAESLNRLRKDNVVDLLLLYLVKCDEDSIVFNHYLQHALGFFWFIMFELKILSNGRLHDAHEEKRYAKYIHPEARGSFPQQSFTGSDSETECTLSELSCDGIQFGAIKVCDYYFLSMLLTQQQIN